MQFVDCFELRLWLPVLRDQRSCRVARDLFEACHGGKTVIAKCGLLSFVAKFEWVAIVQQRECHKCAWPQRCPHFRQPAIAVRSLWENCNGYGIQEQTLRDFFVVTFLVREEFWPRVQTSLHCWDMPLLLECVLFLVFVTLVPRMLSQLVSLLCTC